jgi:hypothetical protein
MIYFLRNTFGCKTTTVPDLSVEKYGHVSKRRVKWKTSLSVKQSRFTAK